MSQYRKAILFPKNSAKKDYTVVDYKNAAAEENINLIESLYIKEISKYHLLDKDEEYAYIQKSQEGDPQSREKIVAANLRLVFRIARRYVRCGVSVMDLVAEGNFGLLHAIEKFDLSKNHRFSTYASWWVQHYIESYLLNYTRMVRLPIYLSKKISKIKKKEKNLSQKELGRITQSDLCEQMGIDFQTFDHLNVLAEQSFYSLEHLQNLDESSEEDKIQDFSFFHSDEPSHLEMHREQIVPLLLKNLNSSEYDVIIHRLGLCKNPEMSFDAISEQLNISKDQVRSLYQKALKKMIKLISTEPPIQVQKGHPCL